MNTKEEIKDEIVMKYHISKNDKKNKYIWGRIC